MALSLHACKNPAGLSFHALAKLPASHLPTNIPQTLPWGLRLLSRAHSPGGQSKDFWEESRGSGLYPASQFQVLHCRPQATHFCVHPRPTAELPQVGRSEGMLSYARVLPRRPAHDQTLLGVKANFGIYWPRGVPLCFSHACPVIGNCTQKWRLIE